MRSASNLRPNSRPFPVHAGDAILNIFVDAEIEALNKEAGARAEAVLKANKKYLDALANALLEKESLEGPEVDEILKGTTLPASAKLHD